MRSSLAAEAVAPAPSGAGRSGRASADRPLDLVQLTRQTFGDKRLETELLRLFLRQAETVGAALGAGRGNGGRGDLELVHMLSGSARAVGAVEVAMLASAGEAALRRGDAERATLSEPDRRALVAALAAASDYVTTLLDQG